MVIPLSESNQNGEIRTSSIFMKTGDQVITHYQSGMREGTKNKIHTFYIKFCTFQREFSFSKRKFKNFPNDRCTLSSNKNRRSQGSAI